MKRAFTPAAVQRIYEAVADVWPDGSDLERTLAAEKSTTSGLYVGTYEPKVIFRGVTRHSIYSDTILLVDPFIHPGRVRDEFNPLIHPEEHRANAVKAATIWFAMADWVEAGLVRFVRVPGDFDSRISQEALQIQRLRFEQHPELLASAADGMELKEEMMESIRQHYVLSIPDAKLAENFKRDHPGASPEEISSLLKLVGRMREAHPYFMDPIEAPAGGTSSEFIVHTTGANYEMAKRTALMSGSHLITDLPSRWKEIEIDRDAAHLDLKRWTPFAKAFQGLEFKYLVNVPLEAALRLRDERRLEDMRGFLRKAWRACGSDAPFSDEKVANLAAELQERVREAENEWRKIDADLIKWFGTLSALSASFVAAGGASWVPAAISVAVGGAATLTHAQHQRTSFERKLPAAFFLKLKAKVNA
jgi:hypothetical protein